MIQSFWAAVAAAVTSVAPPPLAQPLYQPPAAWVRTVPIPAGAPASGVSAEILLYSVQDRFTPGGDDFYVETAIRINAPQGLLQAGSIIQTWNPRTETLTIHRARIIRAGASIDLLAGGKTFTILRRESNLEAAMIDGQLTATLQPEGLQVGDVLDVAFTLSRHEPALAGRSEGGLALAHAGVASRLVARAIWPVGRPMRIWKTDDLGSLPPSDANGWREVGYDLNDAVTVEPPEGAPLRDQLRGAVQFSSFKDWPEVSATAYPLYDKAAGLAPDSPLKAEIARLQAAGADPKARALAALQLVEDKVRYLYVGLDAGGLTPATADETWARRFGDCKGKTVLLLALLRGLAVPAEPVLVSTQAGDGLDRRLPQMAAFDHVMIRADIGGRAYWLDGTRLGDANLDILRTPEFHWALPIRPAGGALEPLTPDPLALPQVDKLLQVDARAGIDKPAPAHMEITMRGDGALGMSLLFKQASAADGDRALRKIFEGNESWIKADKVAFAYDPVAGVARLTMDGAGPPPFTGEPGDKVWWIDLSSIGWDADFRRSTTYHADAPYAVDYPKFERSVVEARLPAEGRNFTVGNGEAISATVAGRAFSRAAAITGGRMTMTSSFHTVGPQFPAYEAPEAQRWLHERSLHDVVLTYAPVAAKGVGHAPGAVAGPAAAVARGQGSDALSGETSYQRATAAFVAKDYIHADADFTSAIALAPRSAKLLYDRGVARLALGRTAAAQADFEAALKLDPKDAFALFALGRLALARNDPPAAADRFAGAAAAAQDGQAMTRMVADSYGSAGRYDEALVYYNRWLAGVTDPAARPAALNAVCWAKAVGNRALKSALAQCDEAITLRKDFEQALDSRGFVEFRMGAFDKSIADYNRALALRADAPSSLFGRGLAELRSGQKDKGQADLAAARRLDKEIDGAFAKAGVRP